MSRHHGNYAPILPSSISGGFFCRALVVVQPPLVRRAELSVMSSCGGRVWLISRGRDDECVRCAHQCMMNDFVTLPRPVKSSRGPGAWAGVDSRAAVSRRRSTAPSARPTLTFDLLPPTCCTLVAHRVFLA